MTIHPFGNRILVKPVDKSNGPLEVESNLNEYGEVMAVGEDVKRIHVGYKVGFSVFGIEKLVIDEEKYYFLPEDSEFLLCTITD